MINSCSELDISSSWLIVDFLGGGGGGATRHLMGMVECFNVAFA